jgi:hypothetical protein
MPPYEMRWVHQNLQKDKRTGLTLSESGQRPSLCFRGRKWALCIVTGYPVRILKRSVEDYDRYREVRIPVSGPVEPGKGMVDAKLYPVEDAVTQMRVIAAKNGITKGAEKLLAKALEWALSNGRIGSVDEDEYDDEENVTMENPNPAPEGQTEATNEGESPKEKTVATKKARKGKAVKAAKKAKSNGAAKAQKGPSRISRAVAYMKDEVKKEGGQRKLERGFRKELFERTAKKFDLSPATCSIQYNKQVLNG